MIQSNTSRGLALVPRNPRRKLRQLWIDPRAKDDPFLDCDVAVPFCAVERRPDALTKGPLPMGAYATALDGLSDPAPRLYHLLLAMSGSGKGQGWGRKIVHRPVAALAALAGISEQAARNAIEELTQAKFIERVEIVEQDTGGLGFECDTDCDSHKGFGVHYVSNRRGIVALRVKLHPQHESRQCVCYSGGSTKGLTCSIPVRQFATRGTSLQAAEVGLYQAALDRGPGATAGKAYLNTHVGLHVTERRVGQILAELPLLGIKRRLRPWQRSVFTNPSSRSSSQSSSRSSSTAHHASSGSPPRFQQEPTTLPAEAHHVSNLGKRIELNDQAKGSRETGAPSARLPRVSISDSNANTAMKEQSTGITPAQREAAREVARAQKAEVARAASLAQEAEMRAETVRPKLTEAQEREIVALCELTNTPVAHVLHHCFVPTLGTFTPMHVANIRAMSAEDYADWKPWLEKKAAALAGAARQPASPDFKMTEARVREILSLCDATGADSGKLLAWYKAESFEALTEAQYSAAKSGLENKLAKVKAAAAPVAGWVEPPKAPTAPNRENIENGSSSSSSRSDKPL
jgi:hypothetical protein